MSTTLQPRRVLLYKKIDGTIAKYHAHRVDRTAPTRRLVRQWQILRYLATHPRPVSCSELSRHFGISRSSIRLDIRTLIAAGFAIDRHTIPTDDNRTNYTLIGCCKAERCDWRA